ncbi:hypothetical protein QO004_003116 [Rhizobium mesoamericanum]|nr:hypothetical protein [Rhizobium mesoamericanum]
MLRRKSRDRRQDGRADAKSFGRLLDAGETMRPMVAAAGEYPDIAIIEMNGNSVPVPFYFISPFRTDRRTWFKKRRQGSMRAGMGPRGSFGWEGSRGFRGRLRSGFSSARRGLGRGDFAIRLGYVLVG